MNETNRLLYWDELTICQFNSQHFNIIVLRGMWVLSYKLIFLNISIKIIEQVLRYLFVFFAIKQRQMEWFSWDVSTCVPNYIKNGHLDLFLAMWGLTHKGRLKYVSHNNHFLGSGGPKIELQMNLPNICIFPRVSSNSQWGWTSTVYKKRFPATFWHVYQS